MPRKLTPQSLAKELGLTYGELTLSQQRTLADECAKQRWLKTINEQGFVRARWRGEEIKPKEQIGEVEDGHDS